ncbi:tellurium resistance protein [Paracoccus luteus]|uniref:SLAC1 family transporter n=1 Tax=Paracoccus luteus TaxID=2508543 RepID=UPI001431279B|nr:tellurium resistance protein [Paracoccus luteus]
MSPRPEIPPPILRTAAPRAQGQRLRFAMPRPVPPGLWRRVPPAVFLPILGALALALAWRGGIAAFALPGGAADLLAGAAVAVFAFAALAYGGKLARRPGVLADDLAILPGRAGIAAGVLSIYVAGALVAGFSPAPGRVIVGAGLAGHLVCAAVLVRVLRGLPPPHRRVTPVWHLGATGLIVAAGAALAAGWPGLARALFWPALAAALLIYAASARQALVERVPAALRPLLAIHAAPPALFALVALGLGWTGAGQALAWLALAAAAVSVACARWLLPGGFSALWGALAFPAAATAGAWVALWRAVPTDAHRLIAGGLLVAATLVVVPLLVVILRDWARGRLPVRTNAAIA